jgi:hypothetical protein
MSLIYAEGETLGRAMFGHAELGDRRRTNRLVETFDRIRRHPGETLPDKLASPPNLKALYRLADYARGLPALGQFTMDVQAQRGRKARQDASFTIRAAAVLVHRPHARAGHHGDAPLPLYVVLVSEDHPPAGEKPIVWMLLTNEPAGDLADARRVIDWYAARWVIEEFHKGQKTGCGIESLQFTSVERLTSGDRAAVGGGADVVESSRR